MALGVACSNVTAFFILAVIFYCQQDTFLVIHNIYNLHLKGCIMTDNTTEELKRNFPENQ